MSLINKNVLFNFSFLFFISIKISGNSIVKTIDLGGMITSVKTPLHS